MNQNFLDEEFERWHLEDDAALERGPMSLKDKLRRAYIAGAAASARDEIIKHFIRDVARGIVARTLDNLTQKEPT